MKKAIVIALLMVVALSAVSLAATKRVSAPAPVSSATVGDAWSGKMAVGCIGAIPAFKYHFNKDMMVGVGGTYFTASGGSSTTLLGKFDYTLGSVGQVQTTLGGYLLTTSTAGFSTTTFGGTWGFRTLVQPNMSVGTDVVLVSSTSAGGTSTTGICSGIFLNAGFYL